MTNQKPPKTGTKPKAPKVTLSQLHTALHSDNPRKREMAQMAESMRGWSK